MSSSWSQGFDYTPTFSQLVKLINPGVIYDN